MKHLAMSLLLSAGIACGLVFGADEKEKPGPATTQSAAVNKFCAVMQSHEIDPEVTIVHDGKTIGFCCKDCIDEFKADPEKYLKSMK